MRTTCPRCQRSVELDDAAAGRPCKCPGCHQVFVVPAGAAGGTPAPRPARSGGGSGLVKLVLFGLFIAAAGFGYAMFRFHETPTQTWARLSAYVETLRHPTVVVLTQPTPEPEGTPPPAVSAHATPASPGATPPVPAKQVDALAWLAMHKERWPKEVTLKDTVSFPIVYDGREAGTGNVPPGSAVRLVGVEPSVNRLAVACATYGNSTRTVAIDRTDLPQRALAALAAASAETKTAPAVAVAAPVNNGGSDNNAPTADPALDMGPVQPDEAGTKDFSPVLGAVYTPQATTFRLFAPGAKAVSVVLYDAATETLGRVEHPLKGQDDFWEGSIAGDLRGKFYAYRLDGPGLDSKREVLDPYAVNAVASSTRGRITELTPPTRPGPRVTSATDLVVYEMHVRDFTIAPSSDVQHRGLYLGFTEPNTHLGDGAQIRTALDHLTELGVTHVELLPVQDFANDESKPRFNWGYITTAFFSPEGMYATNPNDDSRVREFKALIDALHARGLGVIMDVVYNHTAGDAPFQSVAPGYYYRHDSNGKLSNGSGCGNEWSSETPMARRLILDSLKFWTREYGIDGYRFDLMALLDQDTMRQAERELRAINPNVVLFGEPWTGGQSPLEDKTDKGAFHHVPVGAFNDDFRNALKGSPDGHDPGFIQNGSHRDALENALRVSEWLATPAQSINYMTCHDNLVLWDKLKSSMPNADDHELIETMKLGYLALLTSQGVPYMQGGEEFGRTKGGNNNSYNAPDSVNEVDWSLKRRTLRLVHVRPRRHRVAQGASRVSVAQSAAGRGAAAVRGRARQGVDVYARRVGRAGRGVATGLRGPQRRRQGRRSHVAGGRVVGRLQRDRGGPGRIDVRKDQRAPEVGFGALPTLRAAIVRRRVFQNRKTEAS